ncbi:MAG: hypothetical protein BJ554DRAFT_1072 [Olpidium bornovanus]|uniref:Uncharacterized protein n=1 Tax=Olpidium bornovanus TaxID=278681 RepID=A0A8H8DHE4_9FUNG|nr:MAG: hypothetical protein BJ554DRAFT_1072 [Olpidium bornovanus]
MSDPFGLVRSHVHRPAVSSPFGSCRGAETVERIAQLAARVRRYIAFAARKLHEHAPGDVEAFARPRDPRQQPEVRGHRAPRAEVFLEERLAPAPPDLAALAQFEDEGVPCHKRLLA